MSSFIKTFLVIFLLIGSYASVQAQETDSLQTTGMASYYHDKFEGRPTASGQPYRKDSLTAAHPTLPFNTLVRVTNLSNDKSVVVKVNDRGPFVRSRIIDVSKAAAIALDFLEKGLTRVEIQVVTDDE
ncbi:septal ring lytic transglycosylase RlpA family protein [Robertkochia marina]|uniref:Probable endolytic peptidoglycan transglycosylase RlpA n=1 Tax=Robertkochia marina TaxID=1227945 RepID=A0A4S3M0I5_9FLAO|nr:septal ring lytic transglycosylase RlpA family protein [Robertkochia marina]THD67678.1 septal ring lytic transglycosylase RlpA family protein [Robertkochia marina]TRZ43409.1 septal ring lytic transglycosylase RlpA family protein [Robertkochia marina]